MKTEPAAPAAGKDAQTVDANKVQTSTPTASRVPAPSLENQRLRAAALDATVSNAESFWLTSETSPTPWEVGQINGMLQIIWMCFGGAGNTDYADADARIEKLREAAEKRPQKEPMPGLTRIGNDGVRAILSELREKERIGALNLAYACHALGGLAAISKLLHPTRHLLDDARGEIMLAASILPTFNLLAAEVAQ